jgi:hypothetical protein
MAGQPQPKPVPKAGSKKDQQARTWAIIGFASVGVLAAGYFALNALVTEDRGGRALVKEAFVPMAPERKPVAEEPVALAPRPIRLFDEYVKAIHRSDRKSILAVSEVDETKIDLLLTEERVKIVTEALQSKNVRPTQQAIADGKADMAAIFPNGKGFDVMELRLLMRQRGGADDWVVTRIEDRWFAASGKMPESRTVELGADRKDVAAPFKEVSTFGNVPEADPRHLDWLPGTAETQKAEIERHMRDLFDVQHPAKLSGASQALVTIGKPAIPRLLTELATLDVRKDEDILRGNAIDRTLAALTDLEMGYDPASFQSMGAMPPAQQRQRAVRRWFGWWERNKDRPLPLRNQPEDK